MNEISIDGNESKISVLQATLAHHRVQRLIASEDAKRMILDDITVILKYFWQMTIARSKEIIRDDTCNIY